MLATLLLVLLCLLVVDVDANGSYTYAVPYGREECILVRVPKGEPHVISGSFDCIDTKYSSDPVKVGVYNGYSEELWMSEPGSSEGLFSLTTSGKEGKHYLCLENAWDHEKKEAEHAAAGQRPWQRVTRTIGFSIRVKKARKVKDTKGEGGEEDPEETQQRLVELVEDLNERFQALTDHMSFMKTREVVHRELHEQTFTKVVNWNILEICTLVVITLAQVVNVWWILSKRRSF